MPNPRKLGETANRVEARARALQRRLEAWMAKVARREARRAIDEQMGTVAKVDDDMVGELRAILTGFGLAQAQDAAQREAGRQGVEWLITPQFVDDFVASHEPQIQALVEETRTAARNGANDIIRQALAEEPTPSAGEIARRIRSTFHGQGGTVRDEQEAGDPSRGILPTTRYTTDKGNLYAFSSERAALIARTELAQAENTGIVDGYRQTGVVGLEWLSYKGGGRGHGDMNGTKVRLGEAFTLPDGTRMRHPGDPSAPIKHLANCRCTVAPVFDESELD